VSTVPPPGDPGNADDVGDAGGDANRDVGWPTRRRRGPRLAGLTLTVLVLAAAGTGTGYWLRGQWQDASAEQSDAPAGPAATAEVTRETISATESFGGTLGHGAAHTVAAQGQGTVTGLAAADAAIEPGAELYRLDETPVTALHGAIPMYRDLRAGATGVDVEQLERNLAELGYGDSLTVDDEFTEATGDAVRAWQADLGVAETGVVARTAVVFVPRGARVDSLHADVGDPVTPGMPVLDFTGSAQVVSLDAEIDDRDLLPVDAEVTLELPDGRTVAGTVTAANVATAPESEAAEGTGGEEEAAGSDDAVAEIEVTLAEEVDSSLLGSPVDVVAKVEERENVLVVPVSALLARSGGGYGLEVVAAGGTSAVVPVETGLFADGKVEIEGGEGIDVGTVVGVAGR
jgi:peptidoglycan hydrolase-like protein with peptidoglycan-binding domain